MDINGKVVIVTGASEGIGEAIARLFGSYGARLALVARSADRLNALAAELPGALAVPADMSDPGAVREMVAAVDTHFGRIDVLINNAGQGMRAAFEDIDTDTYRRVIDLNLIGPLVAMQTVAPIMRRQGGGVIINVSSQVSHLLLPGISGYAATKAALDELTLTARIELAPDNIRVGLMYPGMTATRFGENAARGRSTAGSGALPPRSGAGYPAADPPEAVARRVLEAVEQELTEQFMDAAAQERLAQLRRQQLAGAEAALAAVPKGD